METCSPQILIPQFLLHEYCFNTSDNEGNITTSIIYCIFFSKAIEFLVFEVTNSNLSNSQVEHLQKTTHVKDIS